MENNGDHISFVFPTKCESLEWVKSLSKSYKVSFGIGTKLYKKIIRTSKIDAIYTHFCLPKTQAFAKLASRLTRIPLIQHWHNHYQKAHGVKGIICNWAFTGDMNIACSEPVMNSLPFPDAKKCYVDNAIDFTRLDHYDKLFQFEKDSAKTIILMFGFDLLRKGVDLAIEALAPIAEKNKISLIISLSKNHEKIRTFIQQRYNCIPTWVQIVDARDDVATYYHAANIFLSAAREEGFCYALVEAAYCGCNVISSTIDGVPYQIIPYCRTFPSEDVTALRNSILDSMKPNTLQQKEETTRTVKKQFDLDTWAEKVVSILKRTTR